MDQRTLALVDNARKYISRSKRFVNVTATLNNWQIDIDVQAEATQENLNQINSVITSLSNSVIDVESDVTGCAKLSNIVYLSLAQFFSESQVNMKIKLNEHTGVTIIFNNNSSNQGK
jgi:thymidine kinase